MKLALLAFSFVLFLSLLGGAQAATEKREITSVKETKVEKKKHMDDLRSRLQGFNGRMRI